MGRMGDFATKQGDSKDGSEEASELDPFMRRPTAPLILWDTGVSEATGEEKGNSKDGASDEKASSSSSSVVSKEGANDVAADGNIVRDVHEVLTKAHNFELSINISGSRKSSKKLFSWKKPEGERRRNGLSLEQY